MAVARRGRLICWAMLAGLGGCSRAISPPPGFASTTTFLSFLDPQGPVAAAQRAYLIHVTWLLLIVVLPVLVLTPIVAWRYRLNGSARYTPRWSFYRPLEFVVWGVPIAIVIVLGVWLHQKTKELDPYAPLASSAGPPLRVEVVGYDWKWLFIYPQFNIASIGEFAFPAGRALEIVLTSDTVMQSFFIPALGSQIYAMPGMVTRLHLLANAPGSFRGENTQFNGSGFAQQDFTAKAMPTADFQAWVKRVQTGGIPLSQKAYGAISQRSTLSATREALGANSGRDSSLFFADVSSNLFDMVVQSFTMGSSGSMDAATHLGPHGSGSPTEGH
ncbi:MAG: cytochrome ubiquinol oxidase subunit II [Acetobacteraceae bacterium]